MNQIDKFSFREVDPNLSIGTASDRYAGWIGQIYSRDRYGGRIATRTKKVGGQSFKEELLPVESVEEYFQHFSVLELDFTFYRPLLDEKYEPTPTSHVLRTYERYLGDDDRVLLKVPQVVSAQKLWRKGRFVENPDYLNVDIFVAQFYEPALDLLGDRIGGFIFEQEYQPKKGRIATEAFVTGWETFFQELPRDDRYHLEVRTESLLTEAYFDLLQRHGIGQVLSHWTWLPPLMKQFHLGGGRFLNAGKSCIIRLMSPLRMNYAESYQRAFPFDKMVEGMMTPRMIDETIQIVAKALKEKAKTYLIINNRAGGNAPEIARHFVKRQRL
jgi:uncharacterized protein YecE (DUF72 family)